jgi:hypothetical protein
VTTTLYGISTIVPPPVTQTSTTTTTATASETLYPIITTWTTTEQATLTICPTRTLNPTFTAQYPVPTEFTWGCPPGYLCKPEQINCNFEAGIPAEDFYCSPDQCVAASALGVPQVWDTTIYGNSTPATDPSLRFNVIDHYFNMNPADYGLSYDIFVEEEAFTFTSTIGYAPTAALAARQAETSIPGTCYPWCNDCLIEAQSVGKTPALCAPDSNYEKDLANCQQCIAYHATDTDNFVQIAPQFQQFMAYCDALSAPPPSPTPAPTVYSTSTLTVQPELSLSYSSFITTITSPVVSPIPSATSSSTEWVVSSGSSSVVFQSSPAITTQWIMTSDSSTFVFTTSPTVSASAIMYGLSSTTTVQILPASTVSLSVVYGINGTTITPLLTASAVSVTTSGASSLVLVSTMKGTATSSTSSRVGASSTSPASASFTGAALRNSPGQLIRTGGLVSLWGAVFFLIASVW